MIPPDKMPPGTDPGLLRRINAVSVLQELRRRGAMTLSGLTAATGLSRRTIEATIDTLRADGLVSEVEEGPATRAAGRPARSYRFLAESEVLVGIQVAAYEILVLVTDLNGTVLGKTTQPVRSTTPRRGRMLALFTALDRALASAHLDRTVIRRVSVGTPGIVDRHGYISSCTALPEWSDFDIAGEIGATLERPVIVDNDTNLAAIGERWLGAGAGYDNTIWLLTGRRTSMGLIIAGRPYRGDDGAAGEIGLIGEPWSAVREHPLSLYGAVGRSEAVEAERIVAQAAEGDAAATASIDGLAATIARGLSGTVLSLNPACVVLGGPLAALGPSFAAAIERHLTPLVLVTPAVRASSLGSEVTAIGAVRAALDAVDAELQNLWLTAEPAAAAAGSAS